ncbi:UNVERIFIED_CONTAM: hypothetical protein GTU68_007153 [Idotea baltica]|nr:hypothetical protein [Idotea baltica]
MHGVLADIVQTSHFVMGRTELLRQQHR